MFTVYAITRTGKKDGTPMKTLPKLSRAFHGEYIARNMGDKFLSIRGGLNCFHLAYVND